MIKINVVTNSTHWNNFIKNPNYYIDRKIKKINFKEKKLKKKKIFCTLLLSDTKEIKYLNKKFRKKNKSTDVLSFPFHTRSELKKKLKTEKNVYLGDIIININEIENETILKNFKIKFDRLWIHGLIHLLGHDHKKNKDYLKMNKVEKKYFDLVNV